MLITYAILDIGKAPTPKWMLPNRSICPNGHRLSVDQTERHFYFFLFLLSRKARNATIKLPKATNNVSIPMKIEIISNAVIITHLPSYVFPTDWVLRLGRLPPCHGYSPNGFRHSTIISLTE